MYSVNFFNVQSAKVSTILTLQKVSPFFFSRNRKKSICVTTLDQNKTVRLSPQLSLIPTASALSSMYVHKATEYGP